MKPYRVYEPEWTAYQDRVSGVTVRKLTSYLGHSVHPYFTNNAFYDGGRRFIFTSDRENVTNLFSFDRETGEITQLTDFSDKRLGPAYPVKHINRERNETYYWRGGCLYALSLDDLSVRPLFVMPGKGTSVNGFKAANIGGGMTGAGGNKIYLSGTEDLSDRIYTNLAASYIGFEETFRSKPFCQIYEIDLDTGNGRVVWEEQCWVGHVNPSPALPGILTFCHEGPWNLVDNRMWTLDVNSGKVKQLRPREDPREQIGHDPQIHYDRRSFPVTVIITEGEEEMMAEVTYKVRPEFKNHFGFYEVVEVPYTGYGPERRPLLYALGALALAVMGMSHRKKRAN